MNLTSTGNACELASTSLTQFDAATLKNQRVLLSEDSRAFQITEWQTTNVLTLQDRAGNLWTFNPETGDLTQR